MTKTPEENIPAGAAIRIGGDLTGIAQTGSHASAVYTYNETGSAGPGRSPEARELLEAVDALRERLRATAPGELPAAAAQIAEDALDEVVEAVPESGEPDQGRIQRAVYTLIGALTSVAGLTEAVGTLREAAAPWF